MKKVLLLIIGGFLLVGVIGAPPAFAATPTVDSFTPDSGIVGDVGYAPVDAQHEILELLLREPEESDPADGFDDVSAKLHEASGACHPPSLHAASAERAKPWLDLE